MQQQMFIILLAFVGSIFGEKLREQNIPNWKKQACEFPSYKQSDQSHYICDDKGEVKCLPGWQGDLCDVPICKRGCDPMYGYCQRPGECRCKLGFYGDRCDKCIPLPGCQHGHCNSSFECICNKGWDGLFCSEPICRKECHATRGYCEMPGECRCRLGWSGPTCHDCQVLPGCQHGTCTKPLECKCNPGFTGILCQIPLCANNCSRQHGYCRKPGECRCKVGWMGGDCMKCHPYPGCVNGDCRKPWECNCRPGWGGILCDEKLNYCELNPNTCENGGHCISRTKDDNNFRCLCPQGYGGKRCEMKVFQNISYENLTYPTQNSYYVIKPIPLISDLSYAIANAFVSPEINTSVQHLGSNKKNSTTTVTTAATVISNATTATTEATTTETTTTTLNSEPVNGEIKTNVTQINLDKDSDIENIIIVTMKNVKDNEA